ncbi:MAG: 4Fe-4S dicluster domain-containing protein [Opitutaceae bacterium]|nr:4Fe-4S dicluster domain-containing protein [Opitutaceae bacterium]
MIPYREILWNIPSAMMAGVYVFSGLCAAWIIFWFVRRARLWNRGAAAVNRGSWRDGLARLAEYLATHRTIRRDSYAGWMHALIFWGFIILLVATTLVGIQHHSGVIFLKGAVYVIFKFTANLGGLGFSVGLAMALWRRRTPLSLGRLRRDGAIVWLLWGMLALSLTGFLVSAARIAVNFPLFERWSFVGYALAKGMAAAGLQGPTVVLLHRALWISHAALAIGFFIIVPLSLLKHLFLASYSVMRPEGRPGRMTAPPEPVTSAVDLPHFRKIDLIHADACLTCGRCTEVCPAGTAGKPLDPRSIVLGLRQHLDHPEEPLATQVPDDALWACTSCHACDEACPIDIHIFDQIVTLRRGRVAEGEIPGTLAEALESTAQKSNPFGQPNSARMEWAGGLSVPVAQEDETVELLYWVGCAGSFDPAGREVSRAVVAVLDHLKINYRVLGCQERCTGDPARRAGEEELWRELTLKNQASFASYRVQTILTQCPHCFNAFKNEYPTVGPTPRVLHHSQWLREKMADGALRLKPGAAEKITYHDPCYLSRANHETAAPRAVLAGLTNGTHVEMEKHGEKSFCCGGGGGQIWLDVRGQTRVENIRAAHVENTGAQTVATGCPFCRVMLEAGRSALPTGQGKWRVRDIAELVVENIEPGTGT